VARALNSIGRETSRAALRKIMTRAQASGLLTGRPGELAEQFAGLLWRDLMVSLLLGVAERPNPREIAGRPRDAAAAFLQLHGLPREAASNCWRKISVAPIDPDRQVINDCKRPDFRQLEVASKEECCLVAH
jgi:hypothetical protein